MWAGENALGAIPLLAYMLIHNYRAPVKLFLCSPSTQPTALVSSCNTVGGTIVQELCILTVVISGLAVLSVFHLGPRARRAQPTALTHSLVVISMISLIAGAILCVFRQFPDTVFGNSRTAISVIPGQGFR